MKEINHFYSLTPSWQDQFAEEIGEKLLDNKIIVIPKSLGTGHSFFTQVMPGVSVLYMDYEFTTAVKIISHKFENELYIIHFDLSDSLNLINIQNVDYETGNFLDYGLVIFDNQIKSIFKPALGKRVIVLRLLIDKKMFNEFLKDHPNHKYAGKKISKTSALYYYSSIGSNIKILIQSIKNHCIFDVSFESYLKGTSLKLMGAFLSRYSHLDLIEHKISNIEGKAIEITKNYLLANLNDLFPSLRFLSKMAGMSPTKYIIMFKKKIGITPNQFFIKEKLALANKLLKSGNYYLITEIVDEMNYNSLSYFSSRYYLCFHRRPSEDFIKRNN